MTDTLLEEIREVLLLDSKRTQGEWVAPYYSVIYAGGLFVADTDPHDDCGPRPEHDAQFISAAPTMASLLKECLERFEYQDKLLASAERDIDTLLERLSVYVPTERGDL